MTSGTNGPRSAVFYSTIRNWGWGAPDYIWPKAAAELARRGLPVVAVVRPQIRDRPEIRALTEQGVQVYPQPPLVYRRGKLSVLKERLLRFSSSTKPLQRALKGLPAPHYFVEQSGSYDFLDEAFLRTHIAQTGGTYDVIFHSNRYDPPFAPAIREEAGRFLAGARRNLFNSQWTRELTELQLLHRLANGECFQHVIRFPHEQPLPWPATLPLRLASVSRLDCHHKGLDVLLQGLSLLPPDLPPWTFDFYGRGPDEDYLRQLSRWLGLESRVNFHAHAEDIRAIWQEHHLLVLVSRYEGLAVSMLEAMACGRPVLRTPYGGCAEWITPGETGYVCPAAEPPLIAASLRAAILDHARWPQLGHAGHARIRAQLTPNPEWVFLEPFGLPPAGSCANLNRGSDSPRP